MGSTRLEFFIFLLLWSVLCYAIWVGIKRCLYKKRDIYIPPLNSAPLLRFTHTLATCSVLPLVLPRCFCWPRHDLHVRPTKNPHLGRSKSIASTLSRLSPPRAATASTGASVLPPPILASSPLCRRPFVSEGLDSVPIAPPPIAKP
jgi:hypothetical protein